MSHVVLTMLLVAAAAPQQDATALATELLQAGSESFNAKDAAAMAASYAVDGEITLLANTEGGYEERVYSGQAEIRRLYADLFSNAGTIESKNVVEYARFVGPDLLLIAGTFDPDVAGALTLQFVQIRVRQEDGSWLIRELQVIPIPQP